MADKSLPINYRTGGDIQASYDFNDIANGLGYIEFIGQTSTEAAATTWGLTSNPALDPGELAVVLSLEAINPRWSVLMPHATTGSRSFTSTSFNLQRVIKGKVYVSFTIATSDNHDEATTLTATLYKNSTSIGSTTASVTGDPNQVSTYCMSFNVNQTTIAKGDTIKITISGSSANANSTDIMLYHDALNRDVDLLNPPSVGGLNIGDYAAVTAATNPTEFILRVPFIINN